MRIGIALSGGGARGLAHLGVLKALEEAGIGFHMMAGTSAGSIVGALWGLYGFDKSIKILKEGVRSKGFKKLGFGGLKYESHGFVGSVLQFIKEKYTYAKALSRQSLIPGKILELSIKTLVSEKGFEDLPYPFFVTAFDLLEGREVIFSKGPLWTALYASSAIPGFFPPLKVNDFLLVDGGLTMNIPIEVLLLKGADYIIAIDVGSHRVDREGLNGKALELYMRADRLAGRKLHIMIRSLADIVINPDLGEMSWLDFENIDLAVERGLEEGRKSVHSIKKSRSRNLVFRKFLRRKILTTLRLERTKVFL